MSPPTQGPLKDPKQGSAASPSPITLTYIESLIQRLERRVQEEIEPSAQADLQWELKIVLDAKEKFLDAKKIFETHWQTALPYALMKLVQDGLMMPKCTVEELGGYDPLTKS